MLELVHNLQTALGQRIDQLKWMGPETKKQAHDKLANFIIKIGYPDKWRDVSALQVDDTLSFFDNCVKINEFFNDYNIHRKVNKPVDKTEWQMTPQTINAYYDPSTNEICFPAGILQPPFFNPEADDAWNYGAIGVVIGHEMSHGFDDQGSQFDKTGNVHNWWTAADKKNFEARTKVLADYFSTLNALPDLKVNGKLTLGENIGDNGGINIAHQAFLNSMKQNPLPDKDGYTAEQRFFIAFGNIWAENIRPELLRMYVTTDPHSPDQWRVNGALPQIDAWYKAFNITKKDPLYLPKTKRAEIW
jgi:putative endopeptidase